MCDRVSYLLGYECRGDDVLPNGFIRKIIWVHTHHTVTHRCHRRAPGFGNASTARMKLVESATAPKTPPCLVTMSTAAR